MIWHKRHLKVLQSFVLLHIAQHVMVCLARLTKFDENACSFTRLNIEKPFEMTSQALNGCLVPGLRHFMIPST